MKILYSLLAVVVAIVLPASPASAQRTPTAIVDVISYNDVYEMLQDSVNGLNLGGPSRVVPLVKAMRAKNPNSLVLFAGDTMSPSLWSSQFYGMQMVTAHNALGLDFASLGNHEFDFGLDAFFNVTAASNFPWLNANCYELATGSLLRSTRPRAVKTFNDPVFGKIKIGFFGVMYDMKDSSKGLYWTDPIEAAKVQVAQLQVQGVDFIIALTHQDLADDNRFSKEATGVNLIYAGHDHTAMLQTNFGAPYLKADLDFRSIWTSHIEYFAANGSLAATARMTHTNIPITEELPTDPSLDASIAQYSTTIGVLHARVIGSLCEPLDVTNKLVRAADAPVASIFTEASLAFYGNGSADLTVMNGGGIRTDTVYPAGPLTIGQVIGWSPFGNTLMVIETDGASLKAFIKREMLTSCGAASTIQLNGLYVHPGGFKYTFKCTGAGAGDIASIEYFEHPTRSGPLLDTDTFKLALSNYLYTSEFVVIQDVNVVRVVVSEAEASRIDTALEVYIKSLPNATVCPRADGRSLVSF
ncbi:Calcineurin-like phosphoesterase, partial [Globisporangium splendens]